MENVYCDVTSIHLRYSRSSQKDFLLEDWGNFDQVGAGQWLTDSLSLLLLLFGVAIQPPLE